MTDREVATDERTLRLLVLAVLTIVVVGGAADLWLDGPEDWRSAHVVIELTLMTVSAVVGVLLWRAWRSASVELASTRRSLAAEQEERAAWRLRAEQALSGMAQAINEQFDAWGLTPSEREVALLLLKGHGHKQIAGQTNRSERTVRQHAVAVYSKSGQGGRAELAAFFLEGLMLPGETGS
jgi:DNA-binding CsgD family transcriptional regulator